MSLVVIEELQEKRHSGNASEILEKNCCGILCQENPAKENKRRKNVAKMAEKVCLYRVRNNNRATRVIVQN